MIPSCCFVLPILFVISEQARSNTIFKECIYDSECGDPAMVCSDDKKICVCTRFHEWNDYKRQCILNYTVFRSANAYQKSDVEDFSHRGLRESTAYQKNCSHDDHCTDFSLICSKQSKCVCAKFHHWNKVQCYFNYTELMLWLSNLRDETDHKAELDAQAVTIFYQIGLSGILAVGLGFFGAMTCVFVFCILKNDDVTNSVRDGDNRIEKPSMVKPSGSSVNDIETVSPLFLNPPIISA